MLEIQTDDNRTAAPFITYINNFSRLTNTLMNKARPSDVRLANRAILLGLLFPDKQLSRASISRRTGLSRVAVSEVVNEMLFDGLIKEGNNSSTAVTRGKQRLLSMNTTAIRFVCIDLSQPNLILLAETNILGHVIRRTEHALGPHDTITTDKIIKNINSFIQPGEKPKRIAIAVPGVVNANGTVISSSSLEWTDINLKRQIEKRLHIKTVVDNDTVSAILAERFFGAGESNLLFIKMTRGIGAAAIVNDMLMIGDNHAAGEIGHVSFNPDGPECSCGKHGCLETLVSVTSLRSQLSNAPKQTSVILDRAGTDLGRALSTAVSLMDVNDICVYGPADIVNDTFLEATEMIINNMTTSIFHPHTTIRRCQLGGDIIVQGETISALCNLVADKEIK